MAQPTCADGNPKESWDGYFPRRKRNVIPTSLVGQTWKWDSFSVGQSFYPEKMKTIKRAPKKGTHVSWWIVYTFCKLITFACFVANYGTKQHRKNILRNFKKTADSIIDVLVAKKTNSFENGGNGDNLPWKRDDFRGKSRSWSCSIAMAKKGMEASDLAMGIIAIITIL